MKKSILILALSACIIFSSCASKPKRTMLINTVATSSSTMMENAAASMSKGDYANAHQFIDKAYKMALSIDSYDLLVKADLTKVSIFLSEPPVNVEEAKIILTEAELFAEKANNKDKCQALCALSYVRLWLTQENPDFNELIQVLEKNQDKVAKDPFEEAQFYSVKGDVYRLQKKYSDAEKAYLDALSIFTKECYLSELGVNWYKVAQVRSLNGNKKTALEALENAIRYDRDGENSYALGADYYAKGVILMKDNPSAEDQKEAVFSFMHSADIYTAIEYEALAKRSLDKLNSYSN